MLAIALSFTTGRFHATPWDRHVNEGAVEWPPSPWRLLRALVGVWRQKCADIPEAEVQGLIEQLAPPPHYFLPPASFGHTRHYMPLVDGDRRKTIDAFVVIDPDTPVVAVWPHLELPQQSRDLLERLLREMTYFGRTESWASARMLQDFTGWPLLPPLELGDSSHQDADLIRTLAPVGSNEHRQWYLETRESHLQRRLEELQEAAVENGRTKLARLSRKDQRAIDASLPATLFDALQCTPDELNRAGWSQPPGSRWIQYPRPIEAFGRADAPTRTRPRAQRATVARYAIVGPLRPPLTEALRVGECVRRTLMGCSQRMASDQNAAAVFSGKTAEGAPLDSGHQHAHFLCEANAGHAGVTHLTVFAPMGFDDADEAALAALRSVTFRESKLQLVLLGIGSPVDFGGNNERVGEAPILAESSVWISRTPVVLSRHLKIKRSHRHDPVLRRLSERDELTRSLRLELRRREAFESIADQVAIEPQLDRQTRGIQLGNRFTHWLQFIRQRESGGGANGGAMGYGFVLRFPQPVRGPVTLGYGSHFGLGQFVPLQAE
jgi:CRISPR-associated protein Csb2